MYRPENDAKTPNGLPCWIPGTVLAETIRNQARGTFQRDENRIENNARFRR